MGLSAQSFVFFSSPLHDSLQPGSCCTSHSADMADASPSPEKSPSQLPWHKDLLIPITNLGVTNFPWDWATYQSRPSYYTWGTRLPPQKRWWCFQLKWENKSIHSDTFLHSIAFTGYWVRSSSRGVKESGYDLWPTAMGKAGLTGLSNSPEWVYVKSLSNSFSTFRRRSAGCWDPLLFRVCCRVHSSQGWVFDGCLVHIRTCTPDVDTCIRSKNKSHPSTQMKTSFIF